MGSPLPPHSLIFEKFEKSTAVPDMAPEPMLRPLYPALSHVSVGGGSPVPFLHTPTVLSEMLVDT